MVLLLHPIVRMRQIEWVPFIYAGLPAYLKMISPSIAWRWVEVPTQDELMISAVPWLPLKLVDCPAGVFILEPWNYRPRISQRGLEKRLLYMKVRLVLYIFQRWLEQGLLCLYITVRLVFYISQRGLEQPLLCKYIALRFVLYISQRGLKQRLLCKYIIVRFVLYL